MVDTFHSASDLPLADTDRTVKQILEHGVEVNRKVFAGQRVPPDLIAAYNEATGTAPVPSDAGNTPPNFDGMTVEALEAEIAKRDDIDIAAIEGTGKDGKVVKADLVNALRGA